VGQLQGALPLSDDTDERLAAELRGFGLPGATAALVIVLAGNVFIAPMVAVPVGGLLALLWVRLTRTAWSEIGYARPRSWLVTVAVGTVLGVGFKLAMKALVMPLLGANPVNTAYHSLAGNRALLPAAAWSMLVAGFGEETVFRGFLFQRLGALLGSSRGARVATVLLATAAFALAHFPDQGREGAGQAVFTGLVFGTIYAATRRIWVPMIAHAAFDLTAAWLIYAGLEARVAHLVFR
jgi:membrane protease YdiL (CAAX protease family)